jgi:uncharacterized protein involved in exopolysaccharide biosynthesis
MSIVQFFRILWARKWMILAATASSIVGGFVVLAIVPPRWEAHARVMMSILKPDPITGQVISGAATRTYVDTQTELITDFSVAGQVPEQIGWLTDPTLIASYEAGAKKSGQDFRHWAAQLIIDRTKPRMVEGSNILEITYTANKPDEAKIIADDLRSDYMATSLNLRRTDALRNQQWYEAQAQKTRAAMEQAQTALAAFERGNGVLMTGDKEDVDSAQLRALAAQASQPALTVNGAAGPSPLTAQLTEVDAEIAQMAEKLGPNHPDLQALRARRKAIAELLGKEQSAQSHATSVAVANATAMQRAMSQQKAKVIGNSDKIAKLRELQSDVDLKQDQYNKLLARAGELAQEAAAADAGVTTLGPATVGSSPVFPKKPLIVGGAVFLGLAVGVLSALLAELLARRVRSAEDLENALDAPLLSVIPAERLRRGARKVRGKAVKVPEGSLAQA